MTKGRPLVALAQQAVTQGVNRKQTLVVRESLLPGCSPRRRPSGPGKRPQGVLGSLSLRGSCWRGLPFSSAFCSHRSFTCHLWGIPSSPTEEGGWGAIVPSGASPTVLWLRPRTPSTGGAGEPWSGSSKATRSRMKQCPQSGCGCGCRWLPTTGGSAAPSMGTARGPQVSLCC